MTFTSFVGTLTEEGVVVGRIVTCSGALVKRASAVLSTGGVVIATPPAESPSRDFGSTIFITGAAGDLTSRRPERLCPTSNHRFTVVTGFLHNVAFGVSTSRCPTLPNPQNRFNHR